MIDAHTHLNDLRLFPEADALVSRMCAAGVQGALVVGYDLPSSRRAVELARRYPGVIAAAVGMHPHESKDLDADTLTELRELACAPEVVAYGEIGLDFHYDHSPRDVQRDALLRQLAVAASCDLPIIIHEREAADEVLALIEREDGWARGGCWHCCSVTPDLAGFIAQRLYIGIAGWITFTKADNIRALARVVPLSRLLIETDAPYLAPAPYRGKTNEPSLLHLTVAALSAEKATTLDDVAAQTTLNARCAFPRWNLA